MPAKRLYCSSYSSEPICELVVKKLKGLDITKVKKNVAIYMNKSSSELERMLMDSVNTPLKKSKNVIYSKFPGMSKVCNKRTSAMAFNTAKMLGCQLGFVPETYVLPDDLDKVVAALGGNALSSDKKKNSKKNKKDTFIVKPSDGSQGDGIFLTQSFRSIETNLHQDFTKSFIVQKYISRPMKIDGKKFDLRIYVLITRLQPFEMYLCEEGLVRLCSENYNTPTAKNLNNVYSHLTNYSLNKHSKQFKHDKELDQGSKRTLSSFYKSLAAKGINVEELKKKLKVLAINTGKTILPYMIHNCHHFFPGSAVGKSFQILGLDVMIETTSDKSLNLYLLEINSNPSLSIDDVVMPNMLSNIESDIQPSPKFWESGVGLPCHCKNGAKGHVHRISNVDKYVKEKVVTGALLIVLNIKRGKSNCDDNICNLYTQIFQGGEEDEKKGSWNFKIIDLLRRKYEYLVGFSPNDKKKCNWKPLSEFQFRRYVKQNLIVEGKFSLLDASMLFSQAKKKYGMCDFYAFLDITLSGILPQLFDVSDYKEWTEDELKDIVERFALS